MTTQDILKAIAPHAIVVGSAARGDAFNDIDLVVTAKGLALAAKLFPSFESCFPGQITCFDTDVPIEVFRIWYGPSYVSLRPRKNLTTATLFGVEFRAWAGETRQEA